MGKINYMQIKQNDISIKNLKNMQALKKTITGISSVLDSCIKKYTLGDKHKANGIKKVATIATILAIGGMTAACSPRSTIATTEIEETQVETLQKDTLLDESRDKLFDIIFGENRDETDTSYYVKYNYDKNDGTTSIIVGADSKYSIDNGIKFTYSPDLFSANFGNAPEIRNFLNSMIDVESMENPSQKDLQELEAALEALEEKDFKLDGKNIVAVDEKDKDFER